MLDPLDIALIQDAAAMRYIDTQIATWLHDDVQFEAHRKRLRALWGAGYLRRHTAYEKPYQSPIKHEGFVYGIGAKAPQIIAENREERARLENRAKREDPNPAMIFHELMRVLFLTWVRCAEQRFPEQLTVDYFTWQDGMKITGLSDKEIKSTIVPDLFIRFSNLSGASRSYFVEFDTGSKNLESTNVKHSSFIKKMCVYRDYLSSNWEDFQTRFGSPGAQILFVTNPPKPYVPSVQRRPRESTRIAKARAKLNLVWKDPRLSLVRFLDFEKYVRPEVPGSAVNPILEGLQDKGLYTLAPQRKAEEIGAGDLASTRSALG